MVQHQRNHRRQAPLFLLPFLPPDFHQVIQELPLKPGVRIALVLQQDIDQRLTAALQTHLIEQVREMFPQRIIDERVLPQLQRPRYQPTGNGWR